MKMFPRKHPLTNLMPKSRRPFAPDWAAALVHIAEHYLATVETGFDHAASNIAHRSSSRGRRSARKSAGACPVVERQLKEPNSTSALEKVRVPLSGWA